MRNLWVSGTFYCVRFCIAFLLLSLVVGNVFSQTTYYIDSQSGNDQNNGKAENSAWKTIDKLNSSMSVIKPADIIMFKRGAVYEGQINLSVSGSAGQPVIIEAYGTGDNPVISGTQLINAWRKYTNNIYRASITKNALNAFINGNQLVVARTPNLGNYFRIGTGGTNNYFTDPALSQPASFWNGAKCRIRTMDYTWEVSSVSSFANQAVTLQSNTNFTLEPNQTYYFDNFLAALDTANEWYSSGDSLYVYFSNLSDTSHVYASLYGYGIQATSRSYVTINNLSFSGQGVDGIYLVACSNFGISGNSFADIMDKAVGLNSASYVTISNNTMENCRGNGISGFQISNSSFLSNNIKNIGLVPGYGDIISGMTGIYLNGDGSNNLISGNQIENTGYNGIRSDTHDSRIEYNIVKSPLLMVKDGAGIYTWGTGSTNVTIRDNYVENINHNELYGYHDWSFGIYLDDYCYGNNVIGNIVNDNYSPAIFLHNSYNDLVDSNTVYGTYINVSYDRTVTGSTYQNTFTNNNIFSMGRNTSSLNLNSSVETTFGTFSNNVYFNPFTKVTIALKTPSTTSLYFSLAKWKNYSGQDANSKESFVHWNEFQVTDTLSTNQVVNGTFDSNLNSWDGYQSNFVRQWTTNSNMTGGCAQMYFSSNSPTYGAFRTFGYNINFAKGKFYQVSYDSYSDSYINMYLRDNEVPSNLNERVAMDNTFSHYNYTFNAANDFAGKIIFNTDAASTFTGNLWVDNVTLYEVSAVAKNYTDSSLLLYNTQSTAQSFNLGTNIYKDTYGISHTGSITLAPWRTSILVKTAGNLFAVNGITLNQTTANINVGSTQQLIATVSPSNASNQLISWTTSIAAIATVNSSGLITAVCAGSATITATTLDGNKSAICTLTVTNPVISINSITVSPTTAAITTGSAQQLTATISPSDASNKTISWTSDNTTIASINANGLVTAIAEGSATITATTQDGNKTATCLLTITNPVVSVTAVSMNLNSVSLTTGNTQQLTATISPSNASNKTISWTSDNTTVASINANGLVTAIAAGSAAITATTQDGNKTATCLLTITNPIILVTAVTLNSSSSTLTAGNTQQLTATVSPSNASNKNIIWTSSNTAVATVNSSGLITAVMAGTTTITATTQDGTKTASYLLTVSSSNLLPSPWLTSDIGTTVPFGTASFSGSTFTIQGSGADIWNSADAFRYVYQLLTGDVTITARVVSQSNTNVGAKAGVMIRAGLDAASVHAMSAVTPGCNLVFQYRTATGGTTSNTTGPIGAAPYWVRMQRTGSTFSSFASVDGQTWIKEGSATITMPSQVYVGMIVTSHNNGTLGTGVFDNVAIVSVKSVTGILISPATAIILTGTTQLLSATVTPSDATNKSVLWSSANSAVATVNTSGLVTAIAPGTTTITATTQDGAKTAGSTITVNAPIILSAGVSVNPGSSIMNVGATLQLTANISPSNTTNKSVTWSSDNLTIASVSSSGLVTAISAGTATLTAKTVDQGFTSTCIMTVSPSGNLYFQIINRWQTNTCLYDGGNGQVKYITNPGTADKSAQWSIEYMGSGFYELKNRNTGNYLFIDNVQDYVQSIPIMPEWWSAQWGFEATGDGWLRLRNRWQISDVIHIENLKGYAQYLNPQNAWYSTMWHLVVVGSKSDEMQSGKSDDTGINFSPNPVIDELRIDLNGNSFESLVVYDIMGKIHYSQIIDHDQQTIEIDLSGMKKGIYLINLKGGLKPQILKVIKE